MRDITVEKNKISYIIEKLSVKDKIIVFVFLIALLLSAAMMIFGFLFGKFDKKEVFFPAATMSDTNLYQKYTLKKYENLPITISFPTIPYGMYVGGKEQVALEDGCSFSYNEHSMIVVCEVPHDSVTSDIIRNRMHYYLFGRNAGIECVYEEAYCCSGYMNSLYADYVSGTYIVAGVERYLVGYRYYTGLDKDILFFVETEDGTVLPACKHLLDQMYYTMFSYDPADGVEAVTQSQNPNDNEETDSVNGDSVASNDLMERKRLMEELQERIDQNASSNSVYTMDDSDLYVPVMVNDSYESAVFLFTYTNIKKRPEKMLLYAPDGTVYDKASLDELTGEISFRVEEPEQGEWIIVVSNEGGLGTYHAQIVEERDYETLHDDNAYAEDRQGPPAD